MRIVCLLALALALSVAPIAAHDMWIEPTEFAPEAGKIVGVKLRVGEDLLGDPIPRDPALIEQFVSIDSTGRNPVYGRDGADPAGLLRVTGTGPIIIGYQSHPSPVALQAAKFNQYLKEEGLEAIAELRASRKQTGSGTREIFMRCAKSLLLSGLASDAKGDRALGFVLELVAEKNPYRLRPGEELPVRLTYEGRPLEGALVVAISRKNPMAKVMARTDKNGHVTLRLPQDGMWMIKAVHMTPAPAGANADWTSFWASLTFEMKRPMTGVTGK